MRLPFIKYFYCFQAKARSFQRSWYREEFTNRQIYAYQVTKTIHRENKAPENHPNVVWKPKLENYIILCGMHQLCWLQLIHKPSLCWPAYANLKLCHFSPALTQFIHFLKLLTSNSKKVSCLRQSWRVWTCNMIYRLRIEWRSSREVQLDDLWDGRHLNWISQSKLRDSYSVSWLCSSRQRAILFRF